MGKATKLGGFLGKNPRGLNHGLTGKNILNLVQVEKCTTCRRNFGCSFWPRKKSSERIFLKLKMESKVPKNISERYESEVGTRTF